MGKLSVIKCPECGEKFKQRSHNHKYCSSDCRKQANCLSLEDRNCKHCGEQFSPARKNHVFCGRKCKDQYKNDCRPRKTSKSYKRAERAREQTPSLQEKQVILGTVLGDGHILKTSRSYCLALCHGNKDLDYMKWKVSHLRQFIHADIYGYKNQNHIKSISHPYFSRVRSLAYDEDGIKFVSEEYLSLIKPLGLAVWYMDDGSYNHNPKSLQATLCTESFGLWGNQVIHRWFVEEWGIDPHIQEYTQKVHGFSSETKTQYRLVINRSQTSQFFSIISPHIPPCMSRKAGYFK